MLNCFISTVSYRVEILSLIREAIDKLVGKEDIRLTDKIKNSETYEKEKTRNQNINK